PAEDPTPLTTAPLPEVSKAGAISGRPRSCSRYLADLPWPRNNLERHVTPTSSHPPRHRHGTLDAWSYRSVAGISARPTVTTAAAQMSAVWYFAYGSNMQSATFRGRRRIPWTRAPAA